MPLPQNISISGYPFGMQLLGRDTVFGNNNYRFGFNTQEKEDEIYGEGNATSAEYWMYDARLGRRWNLDPIDQISISNYATFANNPTSMVDPMGDKVDPASQGLSICNEQAYRWS